MVGAIILAAGAGSRMGGVPKALLELDGVTFLETITRSCHEAGCPDIWVVTRAEAKDVVRLAFELEIQPVPNPSPEQGMFSSVLLGLAAALEEPELTGVLLIPVDHPHVASRTLCAIANAIEAQPADTWIQPGYRGQSGHPVGVSVTCAQRLTAQPPTVMLRDALRASGLTPVILPVDDAGILKNVNEPGDLPPT